MFKSGPTFPGSILVGTGTSCGGAVADPFPLGVCAITVQARNIGKRTRSFLLRYIAGRARAKLKSRIASVARKVQ